MVSLVCSPFSRAAARVNGLNDEPVWRPLVSVTRLNLVWPKSLPPTSARTAPLAGRRVTRAAVNLPSVSGRIVATLSSAMRWIVGVEGGVDRQPAPEHGLVALAVGVAQPGVVEQLLLDVLGEVVGAGGGALGPRAAAAAWARP